MLRLALPSFSTFEIIFLQLHSTFYKFESSKINNFDVYIFTTLRLNRMNTLDRKHQLMQKVYCLVPRIQKIGFQSKSFPRQISFVLKQKHCFIQKMKIGCHSGVKFTLENIVYGARTNTIKYPETHWDRYSSVVHLNILFFFRLGVEKISSKN